MNKDIIEKLDELLAVFDNSEEIKQLKDIKEKIYSDKDLEKIITEYKKTNTKYNDSSVELKREIINNKLVSEYKLLENNLYFLVLEINKKLNTLINERSCFDAHN